MKKHEEVWLLDQLEELGMEDPAFRSRDYVVALNDDREKVGFGRLRTHTEEGRPVCELTNIGVLDAYRGEGVGARIVEALVENAAEQEFEAVYSLTPEPDYLAQFGFTAVGEDDLPTKLVHRLEEVRGYTDGVTPVRVAVDDFFLPLRLREDSEAEGEDPEEFGVDTENATYKYDTGRK